MNPDKLPLDAHQRAARQPVAADQPPWEELESGRYMPRRIRGSFRGRALG
ncbi:MAG: hypothetical protein RMJ56_12475 [Gemmataceae bacterium]|nr:hypothetical protein [Gemmata sp.]MDW8198408.1 hypothetical protein [Gemmataceae bacterium]